jgi:hypothetical protein
MAFNRNFKNLEEARDFIRKTSKELNPYKARIKHKVVSIVVGNDNDYDLLTKGLVGMKNVKWIGIEKDDTIQV